MSTLKIGLLLSYICIASISAAIVTPALPQIESYYHLSHGALEWIVSIFLLGYTLGQLIYAPLANRYGKLFALRIGLIINLAGILLCIVGAILTEYALLLVGRFITALGAASGLSCTFMLMNELLPEKQLKLAMSFTVVSFTVGIGLAVVIGGILTTYFTWQACFYCLLLHGIVMLFATWLFKENFKTQHPINIKRIFNGYLNALSNKKLLSFSFIVGFVSVFAYGYSAVAPVYAQAKLGLNPSTYGYWNLINMVGMFVSGFIGAKLIKHITPIKVLILAMVLLIPCFLSLIRLASIAHPATLWFFVTTAILYVLTGLIFSTATYFASNAITDKANASSMMSFINMGSGMLGVIIMGYLPFSSLSAFNVVFIGFYILCTALLISVSNKKCLRIRV